MAHVVIMGAGIGGLPAAYEMKAALNKLGKEHEVTVVSNVDYFHFVPSNPWVAVGWRTKEDISFQVGPYLNKKGINFVSSGVKQIHAKDNRLTLHNGQDLDYDYLIITTGPRLAFELIDGLGPDGHTESICHVDHAVEAYNAFEAFCKDPGPIVVGAVQGASCFGPAYEFAMILDTELRKRGIRDKVPMTFVTAEPYIGHLGLGGVGDSKGMLESEMRQRHIKWHVNAKTNKIEAGKMFVETVDKKGETDETFELDFKYAMMLPAFRGIPPVAQIEEMCNPMGFVKINDFQQNPEYENIYSAGVCVAIPPTEVTPVPCGTPKTGYLIETMVTASVENICHDIKGEAPQKCGTWNAICLADMGDTGAAFVALPQIPPRNVQWMKKGKWVHTAKVMFEKYFVRKMKTGVSEPFYEKAFLKVLGINLSGWRVESVPEIIAEHLDGVAFRVTHRGHSIVMDQPIDNEGGDSGMTPPELFASSLAGCVGYYVANYCRQVGLSTQGLQVSCSWATVDKPKRMNPIHLSIELPGLPEKRRRAVERVAGSCLLHTTLTHQPEIEIMLRKT